MTHSEIGNRTSGAGLNQPLSLRLENVIRFIAVSFVIALVVGVAFFQFSSASTSDFTQFYSAGQMVRQGLGSSLYDIRKQAEIQSRFAQVQVFYNHPPFETLIFLPFTYVPYSTAFRLWTIASLLLLIIAAYIIQTATGLTTVISLLLHMRVDLGLVIALFVTFAPVTTCLFLGQDSVLMLVVYSAVFVLLNRGRDFRAGCVLACGLLKFHLILPFALILLLRRKWSALKGLSLVGLLLVAISVGISGTGALVAYPRLLLFDRTYQSIGGFAPEFMPNLRGLLFLVSGGRLAGLPLGLLLTVGSPVVLWYAASKWRDDQLPISFASSVLATLLCSYHLYNYDLTLLLLPIAILFAEAIRWRVSPKGGLGISLLVLFVPPLHRLLLLHSAYALVAVPIAFLYVAATKLSGTNFVATEPRVSPQTPA